MRRAFSKFACAVIAAVVLTAAQSARADFQLVLPSAIIPTQLTNWNGLLTIPKFDPALGTLTLVTVKITANFDATVLAENLAPSPSNITVTASVAVNANPSPPVSWSLAPFAGTLIETIPVSAHDGTSDYTGPDVASFSHFGMPMATRVFSAAPDLAQFIGGPGNNWTVPATGNGSFTVTSDTGNLQSIGTTHAGLKFDVTYNYVPEPATVGLLASGLFLVFTRRRRNR